jgi:hypothetical protein
LPLHPAGPVDAALGWLLERHAAVGRNAASELAAAVIPELAASLHNDARDGDVAVVRHRSTYDERTFVRRFLRRLRHLAARCLERLALVVCQWPDGHQGTIETVGPVTPAFGTVSFFGGVAALSQLMISLAM